MPVLESPSLGPLEYRDEDVIRFPLGLPGFEQESLFLLVSRPDDAPVVYLQSVLTPEPGLGVPDIGLGDAMPDPSNIPAGCRFNPRCGIAVERCRAVAPSPMVRPPQGMVECHLA